MTSNPDRASPRAPRHLLVLANPSPTSFDHSIAAAYTEAVQQNRQEVVVRDLYNLNFNPVLSASERPMVDDWAAAPDVEVELQHLAWCDILVLVYPIWYGLPPAMMKGYVDRVLGAGYSFRDVRSEVGQPGVAGKPLLSFSTFGLSLPWLHEKGQVVSLKEIFDVYLRQGLNMASAEHVRIDSVVPDINAEYAAQQLERVRAAADRSCATLRAEQYRLVAEAAHHPKS